MILLKLNRGPLVKNIKNEHPTNISLLSRLGSTRTLAPRIILSVMLALSQLVVYSPVFADAQPTIILGGPIWDHTPITVLINTTNGAQYLNTSLTALQSWRISIREFVNSYYPQFVPLIKLDFITYISGVNASLLTYDITIDFKEKVETETKWAGLTNYTLIGDRIGTAKIYLANGSSANRPFDSGTMQSIITHEFGHALGLGHANFTVSPSPRNRELMYRKTIIGEVPTFPSTLDIYALAVKYEWLEKGYFFNPNILSVTLPPSIPYRELGLRYVSVTHSPLLINGRPAVKGAWYPESYEFHTSKFDVPFNVTFEGVLYTFAGWYGSGVGSYTGPNLSQKIRVGNSNITEVAVWTATNELNATVTRQDVIIQQLNSTLQIQSSLIQQLQSELQTQEQEMRFNRLTIAILLLVVMSLTVSFFTYKKRTG